MYLDFVGIAQVPYEYEERLVPIYEGSFENIHLFVMDPYDIALCKLKRDNDRDFQDMLFLARTTPFDLDLFEQRYWLRSDPLMEAPPRRTSSTFHVCGTISSSTYETIVARMTPIDPSFCTQ